MKKIFLIFCLGTLSLILSCKSQSKIMQSWVGSTKAQLYQSWGPPSQITDDGQGGEILIYSQNVNLGQQAGQINSNGYGGISYTNPQQMGYTRTRMFYVDKNGVIYSWKWQGY